MCTDKKQTLQTKPSKKKKHVSNVEMDYLQMEKTFSQETEEPKETLQKSRICEKIVFFFTTVAMLGLSHAIVWAQWTVPIFYIVVTPIVVGIKTAFYWKNKWQYFMIDFCYIANALLYVYLWIPENGKVFRVVFALANGPVLVAALVYRNSLVYHHHDKVTSVYIHFLPALVTFCIRWFPVDSSLMWHQPFVTEMPDFDLVWLYAVPLCCYMCHSALYCLIVNVVVRPKDPYVTSYSYLAVKYEGLKCLEGPVGQGITYYGINWLFCLSSLLGPLVLYSYFPAHCAILAFMFLAVVWNGGSYYVHVFSARGFDVTDG